MLLQDASLTQDIKQSTTCVAPTHMTPERSQTWTDLSCGVSIGRFVEVRIRTHPRSLGKYPKPPLSRRPRGTG